MKISSTFFLIDDDADDREIFSLALEDVDKSYKFYEAKNGVEALKILNADKTFIPDFIFLDLNMPFLSGKECLQEIKKLPWLSHIPVVIYSTSSNQKDIDDSRELGAAHFFTKPSSISKLTNILTEFTKKGNRPFSLNKIIVCVIVLYLIHSLLNNSFFHL